MTSATLAACWCSCSAMACFTTSTCEGLLSCWTSFCWYTGGGFYQKNDTVSMYISAEERLATLPLEVAVLMVECLLECWV